ncbi:hypothetical protein M885DRAFT_145106 [Pelagophyceae sp. CCMP2097]|nr:hypothetical protein M885DRAFT_145106 [Pelagophyceae sp. CCMP2097]
MFRLFGAEAGHAGGWGGGGACAGVYDAVDGNQTPGEAQPTDAKDVAQVYLAVANASRHTYAEVLFAALVLGFVYSRDRTAMSRPQQILEGLIKKDTAKSIDWEKGREKALLATFTRHWRNAGKLFIIIEAGAHTDNSVPVLQLGNLGVFRRYWLEFILINASGVTLTTIEAYIADVWAVKGESFTIYATGRPRYAIPLFRSYKCRICGAGFEKDASKRMRGPGSYFERDVSATQQLRDSAAATGAPMKPAERMRLADEKRRSEATLNGSPATQRRPEKAPVRRASTLPVRSQCAPPEEGDLDVPPATPITRGEPPEASALGAAAPTAEPSCVRSAVPQASASAAVLVDATSAHASTSGAACTSSTPSASKMTRECSATRTSPRRSSASARTAPRRSSSAPCSSPAGTLARSASRCGARTRPLRRLVPSNRPRRPTAGSKPSCGATTKTLANRRRASRPPRTSSARDYFARVERDSDFFFTEPRREKRAKASSLDRALKTAAPSAAASSRKRRAGGASDVDAGDAAAAEASVDGEQLADGASDDEPRMKRLRDLGAEALESAPLFSSLDDANREIAQLRALFDGALVETIDVDADGAIEAAAEAATGRLATAAPASGLAVLVSLQASHETIFVAMKEERDTVTEERNKVTEDRDDHEDGCNTAYKFIERQKDVIGGLKKENSGLRLENDVLRLEAQRRDAALEAGARRVAALEAAIAELENIEVPPQPTKRRLK